MNKTIFLNIICGIILLCFVIGCSLDRQILATEKDVYRYLNEKYPTETFEILNVEEIEITDDGCSEEIRKGNSWTIKSLTTNMEFKLEDAYQFDSSSCNYTVIDNYNR